MTITEEREENLDFSDGYYDSEQSLLVPTGSDIAVDRRPRRQEGRRPAGHHRQGLHRGERPDDAEIVSFPSDAEMFHAIQAGQVDALLQDLPVNLEHTRGGEFEIVEKYDTDEQYGFAVRRATPRCSTRSTSS